MTKSTDRGRCTALANSVAWNQLACLVLAIHALLACKSGDDQRTSTAPPAPPIAAPSPPTVAPSPPAVAPPPDATTPAAGSGSAAASSSRDPLVALTDSCSGPARVAVQWKTQTCPSDARFDWLKFSITADGKGGHVARVIQPVFDAQVKMTKKVRGAGMADLCDFDLIGTAVPRARGGAGRRLTIRHGDLGWQTFIRQGTLEVLSPTTDAVMCTDRFEAMGGVFTMPPPAVPGLAYPPVTPVVPPAATTAAAQAEAIVAHGAVFVEGAQYLCTSTSETGVRSVVLYPEMDDSPAPQWTDPASRKQAQAVIATNIGPSSKGALLEEVRWPDAAVAISVAPWDLKLRITDDKLVADKPDGTAFALELRGRQLLSVFGSRTQHLVVARMKFPSNAATGCEPLDVAD